MQVVAGISQPRPIDFPFSNRSYPRDDGSDVLSYPEKIAPYSRSRNEKEKFSILTSKEALDAKIKEEQQRNNVNMQNRLEFPRGC